MDYYYQLEIWKGNINGALRLAREREELSDWLVAMAPMGKFKFEIMKNSFNDTKLIDKK